VVPDIGGHDAVMIRGPEQTGPGELTSSAKRRLGWRFTAAAAAAFLVAVPFTLLVVLVLANAPWLGRIDQGVADRMHGLVLGSSVLTDGLRVVGRVTEPWVLRAIALAIAVALWRGGRRRVAIWLGVTMAVGGALGIVLKELVARARPTFTDPITVAGGYSFPSGHALNSFLFAGCLVVLWHPRLRGGRRIAAWLATIAFAVLVAADRVGLGVHYISDVVAGWVVALATVLATVAAFAIWQREEGIPKASPQRGLDPEEQP
jgi:membrane-associated phospholipid phosphatase